MPNEPFGPQLPEDEFVPLPPLDSMEYKPGFFESIGDFFAGAGYTASNVFDWFDGLFDSSWNLDLEYDEEKGQVISTNEKYAFFNQKNLDTVLDIWREYEDRKSPFYHITNSIRNIFKDIGNTIKGIGEPSLLETAKIVAFIYALTYAYTNIKQPPKRSYNYKSSNRINYRGKGKGFSYG